MIRRSPAERYLIHLVTDPLKLDNAQVIARADDLGIAWLTRRYLDRLRRDFPPPKKYLPKNKRHSPSMRFLDAHKIREIYFPTTTSRAALSILQDGRTRESVEALLLSGCPTGLIGPSIEAWHGAKLTTEVVEFYSDLFFDTSRLGQVELRALLELQAEVAKNSSDPEVRAQYRALRKASRHDPRRIAASMPNGRLAAMATAWKSGKWPRGLDMHSTLQRVRDTAVLRSAITIGGGIQDVDLASQLMGVARVAQELLAGSTDPNAALIEKFRRFELGHAERDIPHIHELEGEHTVDLQKRDGINEGAEEEDSPGMPR